jgi:superfamily II DNA or RNA helicase
MSLPCLPGSFVTVRDRQWRVARVDAFERCSIVTLEAGGLERLRVIEPFDRIDAIGSGRIASRKRSTVMRAALAAACAERPATGLWTAAAATIDLLSYQLEPALAVLRGATRVLLADAVGLGKTIQAGLIVAELRARGLVERALVLCPAGLRAGWANEMQQRFGLACVVIDQASIAEAAAALPPGVNPWATHAIAIASIDFVKRPEVLAALAGVPLDVVIADEAHHLTPWTDRGHAVQVLASRAPWCVLVTATPHSGDEAAFEYLTRLGGHGEDLAIFRRTRRDAGLAWSRRERIVCIRPGRAERELLEAVDRYTHAIWHGEGQGDRAVQLVAITIARRAASSPLALERTLRRRLALLGSNAQPAQALLPWDEEDDDDDSGLPELLVRPGLASGAEERATLEHLLELIAGCDGSAKLTWIARALGRIDEPAIVFTEYRDTLEALTAHLGGGRRVVAISGATPIDQRRAAVHAFNNEDVDVLIATDTAGEGLNLHRRCRLVIDVELPWNPLRQEQRIGRVDRLGQQRRVHGWRLLYADTIEARVLESLQRRRHRAARIGHGGGIDERVVAAEAFGSPAEAELASRPIATTAVDGAEPEQARLTRQRRHARPVPGSHGAIGAAPRRPATAAMAALHTTTCTNEFGSVMGEYPSAHLAIVDPRGLYRRGALLAAIAGSQLLDGCAGRERERLREVIRADLAPLRQRLSVRIAAIRAALAAAPRRGVQRSLFDARAERAAVSDAARLQGLDTALQRRLRSIDGPVSADAQSTRLVAIWPVDQR